MKPKGLYIILSLSLYFAVLFPMQLQSQEQTLFSSNLPWFSNQVNINGQITEKPNLPLPDFAYMELNVVEFSSGNSFSLINFPLMHKNNLLSFGSQPQPTTLEVLETLCTLCVLHKLDMLTLKKFDSFYQNF